MATISSVRIGNLALSHIGTRSSIESFGENSPEAGAISLWYDFAREETLKAHNWTFARKREALAAHAAAPPAGLWSFRYQYPHDCIAARRLINPNGRGGDAVPFEVETAEEKRGGVATKSILTNLGTATLLYTKNAADTSLFTPYFVQMLSRLLAHYIAYALTGKESVADKQWAIYQGMLTTAGIADANEGVPEKPREAETIRARGGQWRDPRDPY